MKHFFVKPWAWVPTLYLGESLPFSAVMLLSVIMFKDFGLSDGQITVYTGWLGLPWVIKPLWSPFIDNFKTKRWWILTMQFVMGIALAIVAFTIPTAYWLQCSLALFMFLFPVSGFITLPALPGRLQYHTYAEGPPCASSHLQNGSASCRPLDLYWKQASQHTRGSLPAWLPHHSKVLLK